MAETTNQPEQSKDLYFTPDEALARAKEVGIDVTYMTLLSWIEKSKLGFQPGGIGSKWYVNKVQFEEFIHGKKKAVNKH